MMTPSLLLNKALQLRLAGDIWTWPHLSEAAADNVGKDVASVLHAFEERLKVLGVCTACYNASVEGVEVDERGIAGIG